MQMTYLRTNQIFINRLLPVFLFIFIRIYVFLYIFSERDLCITLCNHDKRLESYLSAKQAKL